MTLSELDFSTFLPEWMKSDETAMALAYAVENQIKRVVEQIAALNIYPNIMEQSAAVLDELAWQFNIPEYRADLSLASKRALVQSAILTHRQRGAVAAVERVVTDIFGDGWVEEWPDYDGSPYHFNVHTSNISAGDTEAANFTAAVKATQNLRSVLDSIIIESVVEQASAFAGYLHETEEIYI